jgi:hypothetical protein
MADDTNKLLEQIVLELRAMRSELAGLHDEVRPFAEARRREVRMQSPLMGVDLFQQAREERPG